MIYAVLSWDNFRREFTHFWVENFQALKFASVEKRTNIRYDDDDGDNIDGGDRGEDEYDDRFGVVRWLHGD